MKKKLNLDLRIGGTDFLAPYWEHVSRRGHMGPLTLMPQFRTGYHKVGEDSILKQTILDIHNAVGNAETSGYHVVIGNGATQVLMAAINSMACLNSFQYLYAKPPYWFRFPYMARLALDSDVKFTGSTTNDVGDRLKGSVAEIVTLPTNPTNEMYEPLERDPGLKIHDLCYNWPQYTEVVKQAKDIMIFSLAKATGHAGTRIGWALVKDRVMANQMEEYIEYTSGGPSAEAMERARQTLAFQFELVNSEYRSDLRSVFDEGKTILANRWQNLSVINNPNLKILSKSGMFVWAEYGLEKLDRCAMDDFFTSTGVLGVAGERCGGQANQLRLSAACSNDDFNGLLEALRFAD